jgi:hypothetical protein
MSREHTIQGNLNAPKPVISGTATVTFEENMAEARKNIEDTHRILKESEPNAKVIEEWLNRRRQEQV